MSAARNLSALAAGTVFGAGLVVAGMTEPDRVLAFLTVNAAWDPALIFVMGAAVVTATLGFALVRRRSAPLLDTQFHVPAARGIDARLVGGAGLFGVGWGVSGFCPGPAIVGLLTLDARAFVFMLTFFTGVWLYERWLAPTVSVPAAQ